MKYKYSICVSGSHAGEIARASADEAQHIGELIARSGHVTTTGATIGLPLYAARGAKIAGGMSIGYSPARSVVEHVRKYRLPIEDFDYINYTGMSYVGRDLYLVQSSDAVIQVGGGPGSLHEFLTALEAHKPVGILLGSQGTADLIPQLMQIFGSENQTRLIYDDSPERLVQKVISYLDAEYRELQKTLATEKKWYSDSGHAG
jgi:uncharacterized protein (TIGR00725 family)